MRIFQSGISCSTFFPSFPIIKNPEQKAPGSNIQTEAMFRLFCSLLIASCAFCQTNSGELRLLAVDPSGAPVQATVKLTSEVNQYNRTFEADADGRVVAKRLPPGLYLVTVSHAGFASSRELVEIRSALPKEIKVALALGSVQTTVDVQSEQTLVDPYATSSVNRIGGDTLTDRLSAQPGRGLAELINQEPGWMFEANGILHPRAEEYQVQYVVDGMPLTENRSAAYVADFDADNVQEMSEMVAGFPAEYGRKLGGVIEVQTTRDKRQGFHGRSSLGGGSYDTLNGFLEGQYGFGANTLTMSISGAQTDHFLDPPATQNYTNHGTTADFMAHYEYDIDDKNRIGVIVSRNQSKFLVPNEVPQEEVGQRQDRQNFESSAQLSYRAHFLAKRAGEFPRDDPGYHGGLLVKQSCHAHDRWARSRLPRRVRQRDAFGACRQTRVQVWRRSGFRANRRGAQLSDYRSHSIRPGDTACFQFLRPRTRSRTVAVRTRRNPLEEFCGERRDSLRSLRSIGESSWLEPAFRPRLFLAESEDKLPRFL